MDVSTRFSLVFPTYQWFDCYSWPKPPQTYNMVFSIFAKKNGPKGPRWSRRMSRLRSRKEKPLSGGPALEHVRHQGVPQPTPADEEANDGTDLDTLLHVSSFCCSYPLKRQTQGGVSSLGFISTSTMLRGHVRCQSKPPCL